MASNSCSDDFETPNETELNVNFQIKLVDNSGQKLTDVNLHLYQSVQDWENQTNAIHEAKSDHLGIVNWRVEGFDRDTLWARASKLIPSQLKYHFTKDTLIVLSKPVNEFKGSADIDLDFEKDLRLTTVTTSSVILESLVFESFPASFDDNGSDDFQFSFDRCRLSFPDTTGIHPDIAIHLYEIENGPYVNIFESIDIDPGSLPFTAYLNKEYYPGSGPFYFIITNKAFPDFSLIEQVMSSRTNCDYQTFTETVIPDWEQGIDNYRRHLTSFGLSPTGQFNILTLDYFTGYFPSVEEVFPSQVNIPFLNGDPTMISAKIQWQLNYD